VLIKDAFQLVRSATLSASRRVGLVCSFEPLHLQTYLQAQFARRLPADTPRVVTFGYDQLRAARAEVRRDMEMDRDEVRVMTVHGAKGLEANTVILADTTTPPGGPRDPRLLKMENGGLFWGTARVNDVGAMSEARAKAQQDARDEYRRLLYVAMTRAAERLVICGTQGVNKIPDGCWYQLVDNALAPLCVSEPADDGDGEVRRFRKGEPAPEKIETPPEKP